jgi:hypothetical protein
MNYFNFWASYFSVIGGNIMKPKIIIYLFVTAAIMSACGVWGVRGNGKIKEESRSVKSFDKIDVSGAFSVKIYVGESSSLKISGEENLMKFITTRVSGSTLKIDTKKNLSPRKEILIEITTPNLEGIHAGGANNIYAENINTDLFYVDLSGAGNIEIEGVSRRLRAEISGAGNIEAKNLKAEEVRIAVSGAASANVYAKSSLEAAVSGVGSIDYYGNPQDVKTNVSGVGSISRK